MGGDVREASVVREHRPRCNDQHTTVYTLVLLRTCAFVRTQPQLESEMMFHRN